MLKEAFLTSCYLRVIHYCHFKLATFQKKNKVRKLFTKCYMLSLSVCRGRGCDLWCTKNSEKRDPMELKMIDVNVLRQFNAHEQTTIQF